MDTAIPDTTTAADEPPACSFCSTPLRDEAAFCHACGACQHHAEEPALFAAARMRFRRVTAFGILGLVLSVLFFTSLISYRFVHRRPPDDLFRLVVEIGFVALCAGIVLYGLYWHLLLRRGLRCPACSGTILARTFRSPLFAFCPNCGTRVAKSDGPANRYTDRVAAQVGGLCAFCGSAVLPMDAYCTHCGANVGRTLFSPEALIASLNATSAGIASQHISLRLGCIGFTVFFASLPLVHAWLGIYFAGPPQRIAGQVLWALAWLYAVWQLLRAYHRLVENPHVLCPACARDIFPLLRQRTWQGFCPGCGWYMGDRRTN